MTSLRWFAAALVLGFHSSVVLPPLHLGVLYDALQTGPAAVSFFFVLSGFVLTWSHRPGEPVRRFWQNRFARIYPSHLATWLLMVPILVAEGMPHGGRIGGVSLLLAQSWIPLRGYFFAFNLVTWSLSCEAFFYFCFPWLLRSISKVRRRTPLILGLMVVTTGIGGAMAGTHSTLSFWFVDLLPATRIVEFAIGIALALEVRDGRWRRIPLLPCLAAAVLVLPVIPHAPLNMQFAAVTIVPFTLLIAAAAAADIEGRWSPLRGRRLVRLGEMSFALYVVHYPVLQAIALEGYRPHSRGADALYWVVTVAASLVAMVVLHRIVETPCQRVLRAPARQPMAPVGSAVT